MKLLNEKMFHSVILINKDILYVKRDAKSELKND